MREVTCLVHTHNHCHYADFSRRDVFVFVCFGHSPASVVFYVVRGSIGLGVSSLARCDSMNTYPNSTGQTDILAQGQRGHCCWVRASTLGVVGIDMYLANKTIYTGLLSLLRCA